jgi:cell division protein FtsQ
MPPVKRPNASKNSSSARPDTSRAGQNSRGYASTTVPVDAGPAWPQQLASGALGVAVVTGLFFGAAAWLGGSFKAVPRLIDTHVNMGLAAIGLGLSDVKIVALDVSDRVNKQDIGQPISLTPEREQMVREALLIELGEPLFSADPTSMREAARGVGFVKDATIVRLWPDQLLVVVEVARPIAVLREGGRDSVIDALGAPVADVNRSGLEQPILVSGTGAAEAAYGLVKALETRSKLRQRLERAERIGDRRWDILISPSVRVLLPEDQNLPKALETAEKLMMETELFSARNRRVDLRIEGKAFVRDMLSPIDATYGLDGQILPNPLAPATPQATSAVAPNAATDTGAPTQRVLQQLPSPSGGRRE